MARVIVYLNDVEREALQALAEREYRDPRSLIRDALQNRGLLPSDQPVNAQMAATREVTS